MTNQVKIDGELYDSADLTLPNDREFREFWLGPDADGVVQISDDALPAYKIKMCAQVDEDAKALLPGVGYEMVYREKFEQARAVMGNEGIDEWSQAECIKQYPTLAASLGVEANSLREAAQRVITKAEQWADRSYTIERTRLSAKAAIKAATTTDEVKAAYDAATWDS